MSVVPNNIKLKIGCDGVSQLKFHPTKNTLVVGTSEGRVRIYDCNKKIPSEIFRSKWHKTLTSLEISKSGSQILTSSSQGCMKVHDFEAGKQTWSNLEAHDASISKVLYQTENLWISGDENGILKFWDSRQKESTGELNICMTIEDLEDGDNLMSQYGNYLSAINDLVLDDNGRHLFVAMDDGTLVTVNAKKKKVELRSETLGFSARSIAMVKNQSKLAVSTDEGVIYIFNWNQFGNMSDRFQIIKKDIQLETMVKINENIVALSTNTGVIKAASLLPNLVLDDIGMHTFSKGNEDCGDCMSLTVNHESSIIASGCPESNYVCFFSPGVAVEEFSLELQDRMENKRKADRSILIERKKRRIQDDDGFFNALWQPEDKDDDSNDEDDSDSNEEEDDDSNDEEDDDSNDEEDKKSDD